MARKRIDTGADVNTSATAAGSFIKTAKEKADEETLYKTRRVQMLVVPEEWEKFRALAHLAGSNPNEMINLYVRYATRLFADKLRKYEKDRDMMSAELNIIGDKQNE